MLHVPGLAGRAFIGLGAAVLAISSAWIASAAVRRRLRSLIPLIMVLAAILIGVCARIDMLEHARESARLDAAVTSREAVGLEVTVEGFPANIPGEAEPPRLWVQALANTEDRKRVPVLLWLEGSDPDIKRHWSPRTRVLVSGRVQELEPTSAAAYAVSVVDAQRVRETASISGWSSATTTYLRGMLRDTAEGMHGASLVPGFAVGETSLVSETLHEQMLASSLSHLTAVSGANCALVIAAAVWFSSLLGAGRRARVVVAGTALTAFVAVVGPDASVQRAAVMATVVLIARFGGRQAAGLSALGVAIALLLMLDPWQAVHPGFALSVAATGGILILVPALREALRRWYVPTWIALPVAVACAAQIACGPILLLLQPGIPAVGVLANVLAAPAAPVGTGLGLMAMVMLPLWQRAGELLLWCASLAGRWVEATAAVTTELPLSRWHWPGGVIGAVLLAVCTAGFAWALLRARCSGLGSGANRRRAPWTRSRIPAPGTILTTWALLIGSGGVFAGVAFGAPVAERMLVPREWIVVLCDVGQGDAILLRDRHVPGRVMLVDTGDDPVLLQTCLQRFGVRSISLLVLSHDDQDHVGAFDSIAHMVEEALIAPRASTQFESREIVAKLDRAAIPWLIGEAGMTGRLGASPTSAGASWRVLFPQPGAVPASTNAASLLLMIEIAGTRVLLLGDSGEDQHRELLRREEVHGTDVLKVAHHGSGDQYPELLRQAKPEMALISVGDDNRYGHPHGDVLAGLEEIEAWVLRTDEQGTVAVLQREGRLAAWAEYAGGRSSHER